MNDSNETESMGQMGLPEIIQMCCQANRSGQIDYQAGQRSGVLFLQHGQIIHAVASGQEGAEAVFQMLVWPVGRFTFDESVLPNRRTITKTWEQLLFEGALRADHKETALPEGATDTSVVEPVIMTRIQGGQPRLTVVEGESTGKSFEITKEYTHLGRVENNEITLPSPAISSRHCMFITSGNDVIVRDLNSSNGTFVNGQQITEVILQLGDLIQVGPVVLKFESTVKRPKLRNPAADEMTEAGGHFNFHKKTAPLPKPGDADEGTDTSYVAGQRPITYTDLQPANDEKPKTNPLVVILLIGLILVIGGAAYILFRSH
jgi:pSer/pThr/pTyr-binding forkhead associated (FHA) protein